MSADRRSRPADFFGSVTQSENVCHHREQCSSSSLAKNERVAVTLKIQQLKIQQEVLMLKTALTRRFGLLGVSLAALALSQGVRAEDANDSVKTASPIKHVIIIVGENRSFDHLFATYKPKSHDERVLNLLSEHIIKADGTPDENFDQAHQFQITSAPNGGKFFISAGSANKSLYSVLPAPDLAGVQNPPNAGLLPGGDPGLPAADQFLLGTGGTGLLNSLGPDPRITNVNTLPPGPFQLTGKMMPYDAYTGDTIHQF